MFISTISLKKVEKYREKCRIKKLEEMKVVFVGDNDEKYWSREDWLKIQSNKRGRALGGFYIPASLFKA